MNCIGDSRVVAIEGSDYRDNVMKQVRFKVNKVTPRTDGPKDTPYVIDIIDDEIEEDTETFEIFMEIVNFGYAYPNPIGTVTILDDDARKLSYHNPSTLYFSLHPLSLPSSSHPNSKPKSCQPLALSLALGMT